jgi:hypothetical protein
MKAQRKDPCFRDPILIFNLFQKSDRLYFEALERHELFKRFFIPSSGTFLIKKNTRGQWLNIVSAIPPGCFILSGKQEISIFMSK